MKKNYFLALILMTGFASSALAQTNTDAATITGTATVVQAIDVIGDGSLVFGTVAPNSPKTISLTDKVTGNQTVESGERAGRFIVSAGAGTNVNVAFTALPTFLAAGVGIELPINTFTAGYNNSLQVTDAEAFVGTTFVAATGTNIGTSFPTNVIDSKNAVYVFIGATVTPAANQVAGTYTGDITLTATYN